MVDLHKSMGPTNQETKKIYKLTKIVENCNQGKQSHRIKMPEAKGKRELLNLK